MKGSTEKKEKEREEKDNLGKDRLSDLISSSSSRISVEYQINRNEWDKTDKWYNKNISRCFLNIQQVFVK